MSRYTAYEFGHKLGVLGKRADVHLKQFGTRAERIEFCKGYSAGMDAAKRQREVKRP